MNHPSPCLIASLVCAVPWPQSEFVIATSDRPMVLRPGQSSTQHSQLQAGATRKVQAQTGAQSPAQRDRHTGGGAAPRGDNEGDDGARQGVHGTPTDPATEADTGAGHNSNSSRGLQLEELQPQAGRAGLGATTSRGLQAAKRVRGQEEEQREALPPPVMRFCSSPGHVDIHIPILWVLVAGMRQARCAAIVHITNGLGKLRNMRLSAVPAQHNVRLGPVTMQQQVCTPFPVPLFSKLPLQHLLTAPNLPACVPHHQRPQLPALVVAGTTPAAATSTPRNTRSAC